MAEPRPKPAQSQARPPRGAPAPHLEGLEAHETGLAVLILDDEERPPIFIEGEGPHGRHASAPGVRPHRNPERAPSSRGRAQQPAHAQRGPHETYVSTVTSLTLHSTFWNQGPLETSNIRKAWGDRKSGDRYFQNSEVKKRQKIIPESLQLSFCLMCYSGQFMHLKSYFRLSHPGAGNMVASTSWFPFPPRLRKSRDGGWR